MPAVVKRREQRADGKWMLASRFQMGSGPDTETFAPVVDSGVTCRRRLSDQAGFTLIEVLVAMSILLAGVLAMLALFDRANAATVVDRQREGATSLAREITEGARGVPFDDLVNTVSLNAELQAMPGLEDDSAGGGPYTVMRRGTAFTVVTSVCTVDDGKDGGGSRPSSTSFCPDSTSAGTVDANPEDYRRVTATVSWTHQGITRSVTQTGIVNNPGSGPGVVSVVPDGWAAPYEITTIDPALTIRITTSDPAKVVSWSLDGTKQSTMPVQSDATALLSAVDWQIATLDDGPYVITADAFDANGVSGPSRTETITLNRYLPRKPAHVAGGRNGHGSVDIEWSANTERDIIGYEVERTDANGTETGQVVCGFVAQKLETTCIDSSPPDGDPIYYHVRAYDKAPGTGTPRPGVWSDPLKVVSTNQPPFAPPSLSASTTFPGTSSAVVKLTFQRPEPQDPDAGDSIAFFRIYRVDRGAQPQVRDRHDRWFGDGDSITWEDIHTGGSLHDYYVTAVDTNYAESPRVGPVSGG
jgi:prepilin-type N-terminal cleavage/methylation domain-containing protein